MNLVGLLRIMAGLASLVAEIVVGVIIVAQLYGLQVR